MSSSRTQSRPKANSEKSSDFLSELKEVLRALFCFSSGTSNQEKGKDRHRHKQRHHPDLSPSREQANRAYVYQEALADSAPHGNSNSRRADRGMNMLMYRAFAEQDQLFLGPYRPRMDETSAGIHPAQLRSDSPAPRNDREVEARVRQLRAEAASIERHARAGLERKSRVVSRGHHEEARQAAAQRHHLRAEAQLRIEAAHRHMRAEAAARQDELRPETRRFIN
ncbi:hypothetical protein FPOAC2_11793 [Fusarium poae]|uniref:hypothetical protein n=1 Tax=Fusarium poae TaxID=36050 RepID=UPI001CE9B0E9|nr:hypothetical protein FPOAC1_011489 [Fusarium poae]KAG8666678.1 hypothetical protein FPOAC1_011489 [Fusarium poae]